MKKLYFKMFLLKERFVSSFISKLRENEGAGVIEVAVIILILIGLSLIFKDKVTELLDNIFGSINSGLPSL